MSGQPVYPDKNFLTILAAKKKKGLAKNFKSRMM